MKQLWKFLIVGVVLAEWAGIAIAADPAQNAAPVEVKVKPDELPKAVSDALKGRFPVLEITSAVKETENGNVVFDIELTQKSRKFESDIKEDGTILEIEKEVDAKVSTLTTLLEPIIMIILGLGVGALVAGILMPIYNLASTSG